MTTAGILPRVNVSGFPTESPAALRSGFCIGGVSVAISGCTHEDVALVPSLEPFRMKDPFRAEIHSPDIQIQVEWQSELKPTLRHQLFDSGCTWRLYECGKAGLQFDFHVASFSAQPYKRLLIDNRFSHAILQLNESAFSGSTRRLSAWEYPLDELLIMHRLTQEKAIELHGCGIVRDGGIGNLFVGHSGAGKSTTTRLWTVSERVIVLSDDRIIVRPHEDGRAMHMYGTPWHGEEMYASPANAPLKRIFVLEHGQGNIITRLTPSQAVAELFARSFVPFHRHEYVESALSFLQELVDAVPCYRYAFEPDERAVDTILNFHD
jgi:hypothetical protein